MGWFSGGSKDKIEVEHKSSWGTYKWEGKCPVCGKTYRETDKADAINAIKRCKKRCDDEQRRKEQDETERQTRRLAQNAKELRRLAKGKKCPFCGKKPCKGTKPKCAQVVAAKWESTMDTGDAGDPATFDKQLRWYRDNME